MDLKTNCNLASWWETVRCKPTMLELPMFNCILPFRYQNRTHFIEDSRKPRQLLNTVEIGQGIPPIVIGQCKRGRQLSSYCERVSMKSIQY